MSESVDIDPDIQPLVIDNGSCTVKCGFGGDDTPRAVYPTIIGAPKEGVFVLDASYRAIGDDAWGKRKHMNVTDVFDKRTSLVENWNDLEKLWHHSFYNELCVTPEEHPFLFALNRCGSKEDSALVQEKVVCIMFETFESFGLCLELPQVLALYGYGKTTGVVLDCGYGASRSVPVHDGHAVTPACTTTPIGGFDVTKRLQQLVDLAAKGIDFEEGIACERDVYTNRWTQIKSLEGCLFLAPNKSDYEEAILRAGALADCEKVFEFPKTPEPPSYRLPDQEMLRVTLGPERFQAPELFFQPALRQDAPASLEGEDVAGLHHVVVDCIKKCDPDLQQVFSQNIFLVGGSAHITGMPERLEKEVSALRPEFGEIKVLPPDERKHLSWIGGSILSSLATFRQSCILKAEYDECGATIVHRRCQI